MAPWRDIKPRASRPTPRREPRGTRRAMEVFSEMNLNVDDSVQRDLRTLVHFIRLYCDEKHAAAPRSPVQLAGFDMPALAGADELCLCESCSKLLKHALVKRSHCPMQPKPACKHCPSHCYHPTYRAQIREVMAFSGRKLVLRGRLDYLLHLLF